MPRGTRIARATAALLSVISVIAGLILPGPVSADEFDVQQARALTLLNATPCGIDAPARRQATAEVIAQATAVPEATPSPAPSPSFGPMPAQPGQLYATPFPSATPATPPPVPGPTPKASGSPSPVFLTRPSGPPTISPAQIGGTPEPSASPSAAPTLKPGYVAVLADHVEGGSQPGQPGDATGNVNIFYQDEVIVGDRAHYDGIKTITISGHTYIINKVKDTILYADTIVFDTVAQQARLENGRGESSEGVEKGLVYYSSTHLQSTNTGVAHGDNAYLTTCEKPRGGYHVTGKTIDVYPSDKIVISKVILWLGAAAVFYLPRLIIPLRTVTDERQKPQFFPDLGYDQEEGFYVKARVGFGTSQYYYGYYRLEYYTRVGLGLGYTAFFQKRNGRRQSDIDFFRKEDRRTQTTLYNVKVDDTEHISRTLIANGTYTFNSNFGPLTQLPPNSSYALALQHQGTDQTQSYTFNRSQISGQSTSDGYAFTDTRTFSPALQNNLQLSLSHSETSYAGFFSSNASGSVNDLLHWASKGVDYQVQYAKNYAQQPFGLDRVPEVQIRPNSFFQHFLFPLAFTLTAGQYTEPQNGLSVTRSDANLNVGPALYHILKSDFSATVDVHQYAYATGDLKASINQQMTLSSIVNRHITNSITYTETNYNGPALVPLTQLDQQPTQNYHVGQDTLRFFNEDYYNLQLGFQTNFNRQAQPITYQFTSRPSPRSYLLLGGFYSPGAGNGFGTTNVQFITPFGRGSTLQFLGDIDWKNKGRIDNKNIYYSHIVGDCYQIALQYNEQLKAVNVSVNILAFPSRAVNLTLGGQGPVIPGSLNF